MDTMMTFGECLHQWMAENRVSIGQLANATHQKSKTTIVRILRDECTVKRLEEFWTLLTGAGVLPQAVLDRLAQAMNVNRYGKERLYAMQQLKNLTTLAPHAFDRPATSTEKDLLRQLSSAESFSAIVLGYCTNRAIYAMQWTLENMPQLQSIRHYLFGTPADEAIAHQLLVTLPVICDEKYQVFCLDAKALKMTCPVNMLLLKIENGSDSRYLGAVVMPAGGLSFFSCEKQLYQSYEAAEVDAFLLNKRSSFISEQLDDTYHLIRSCLTRETNRAIYQVKREIGVEYISVPVLQNAYVELMAQLRPDEVAFVTSLRSVMFARNRNIFPDSAKREKDKFLLNSYAAMQRFMRTGMLSDHPWMLRPFTKEERCTIVRQLIRQMDEHPHFDFRFTREDSPFGRFDVVCYNKLGVLLYPADTNYGKTDTYWEMLIDCPPFTALYKDFYQNYLFDQCAESREKSREMLVDLLANPSC